MKKFIKNIKGKNTVTNFMGGISYTLNPLDTLKMITASSIFGEPSYYRNGEFNSATVRDSAYAVNPLFADYSILDDVYTGMKTSEIMEKVIDTALDYDFEATLHWAVTLRHDYFMRLNPQVIMVRAAIHPKRLEFTENHS